MILHSALGTGVVGAVAGATVVADKEVVVSGLEVRVLWLEILMLIGLLGYLAISEIVTRARQRGGGADGND